MNTVLLKRLKNSELPELIMSGYTIDDSQIKDHIIVVTKNNLPEIFIIKYPPNYPFDTSVLVNDIPIYHGAIGDRVLQYIQKYQEIKIKILVYSHPYKMDEENKPHWCMNIFQNFLRQFNVVDNYKFFTLDICGKPDIKEDGFSADFINKFSINPQFDFVILPDCGGPWYTLQWKEGNADHLDEIISLIDQILLITKPSGKLLLGKMIDPIVDGIKKHYGNKCEDFVNVVDTSILLIISK